MKTPATPASLSFRDVFLRDHAAHHEKLVIDLLLFHQGDNLLGHLHVCAGKDADPDRVHVFLDGRADCVLGRSPQTRVHHLHARHPAAPGPRGWRPCRDRPDPPLRPVSGFFLHHSSLTLLASLPLQCSGDCRVRSRSLAMSCYEADIASGAKQSPGFVVVFAEKGS